MYSTSAPLCRNLLINGTAVKFQIDTGASLSVMNKKTFVEKVNIPLKPSSKVLKTYTGENVQICGQAEVVVTDDVKTATLPLVVVGRGGPPLLGRDWIQHLHVDLRINTIDSHDKKLQKLLEDHGSVFKSAAGCLRDVKVTLHGKPDTTPKFYRARQPPYALREAIEEELSRGASGSLGLGYVHCSGAETRCTVRICGDYKITLTKSASMTIIRFLASKTWHTHCQVVINSPNSIFPMHTPSFSSTRNLANTRPSTHTKACLHTIVFVLVSPLHRGSFSAPWRVFFDMCQVVQITWTMSP